MCIINLGALLKLNIKLFVSTVTVFFSFWLIGCSGGVQGGDVALTFSGVKSAQVLSPTAIKLSWDSVSSGRTYEIYDSNNSSTPLTSTSFSSAIIENLNPDTDYTFKVVAVQGGVSYGIGKEIKTKTWPRFAGVTEAIVQEDGSVILRWNYGQTPQSFEVFYRKDSAPTALTTNNWTNAQARMQENSFVVTGLDSSSKYYFTVHARYREGEYEVTPVVISATTNTGFSTPQYELTPFSIGALPSMRVIPTQDARHATAYFKSQVFWNGNPVSDPLQGAGTIVFSSNAGFLIGKIEGLTLRVTYDDGNTFEAMEITGLSTYMKGVSSHLETPSLGSLGIGESYFGKVLARGDFNCDGADDLAVGAPDISIGSMGSRSVRTGAVFVYYSKKNLATDRYELKTSPAPIQNPVDAGHDPQVITFDDLGGDSYFGYSLAAGNFNGDINNLGSCSDLVVGVPGVAEAVMLFGSNKGLRSPTRFADIPKNTSTCDGKLEGATCVAVRLTADYNLIPTALTGGAVLNQHPYSCSSGTTNFGHSASFVGDFNADGYEDVAIGNPVAFYNGGQEINAGYCTGAVYVFFGSKYGLGKENIDGVNQVPFVPIYPPIPQNDAMFGASISGGVDIDGKYKILKAENELHGGADMVIGMPGFAYGNYTDGATYALAGRSAANDPNAAGIIPMDTGWRVGAANLSDPASYYGVPQSSPIGAAFVYFGRGNDTAPSFPANVDTNMARLSYWACGSRSFQPNNHWSCFASKANIKMLAPRDSLTRNFGSAVQLLGNESRYLKGSNDLRTMTPAIGGAYKYFSDANGDGFGDIIVAASTTPVGVKASVGVLWQYFGNRSGAFEAVDFYNILSDGQPASDWSINDPQCTNFATVNGTTKQLCKPVLLRSSSLAAGANIAATNRAIDAGDVTGDGLMDLVVGATADTTNGAQSGSVLVYTSLNGKGVTSNFKKLYSVKTESYDYLGTSVTAGNFNGDFFVKDPPGGPSYLATNFPYMDVFAGAPMDEYDRYGGGGVYGFFSNESSLPSIVSAETLRISETLSSPQAFDLENTRIVGDINGDGYDDAVSRIKKILSDGSISADAIIYYGSAIGLITTDFCLANKSAIFVSSAADSECMPNKEPSVGLTKNDMMLPQKIERPSNLRARWMEQAYDAGDVNGDGFDDVIFASDNGPSGLVSLYFGARGGLQNVVDPSWRPSARDPQIVSTSLYLPVSNDGNSSRSRSFTLDTVFMKGDFNNDGYADISIGVPDQDSPSMNTPLSHRLPEAGNGSVAAGDGWVCQNPIPECLSGRPIDGHGGFWILYGSSLGYQTPQNTGAGISDLQMASASGILNMINTENPVNAKPCTLGTDPSCSAAYMRNPMFENFEQGFARQGHHFGASVSVIDVNHDGIDDLMVSSPYYQDISCFANASDPRNYGKTFIFYGSNRGLLASETWDYFNSTPSGCPAAPSEDPSLGLMAGSKLRALMPTLVDYGINANKTSRHLGVRATNAGDVNADGYDDFIMVSNEQLPGLGVVGTFYLYYGPLCPVDNNAVLGEAFQKWDGLDIQLNKQMYFSGAQPPGTTPENIFTISLGPEASTCYRGSGGTLKPLPQKFYNLSGDSSDGWGSVLLGKSGDGGDFNGDGFADILIGGPRADDVGRSITDLGLGVVYFGTADGLFTNDYPVVSVVKNEKGHNRPFLITPFYADTGARFFEGNASVGDVNNDGTADYMITSPFYDGAGSKRGIDLGTFFIFY